MKLIFATLFAFSASAFATCPDLKGTYQCEVDGEQWVDKVEQSDNKDGVVTYYVNGDIYAITDGAVRNIPESDQLRNGQTSASCAENKLVVNLLGDLWDQGRFNGSLDMTVISYKGNNGDLVLRQQGTFTSPDGNQYPFDQIMSCFAL